MTSGPSAGHRPVVGGLPSTFWWLWCGSLVNRLGGAVVTFLTLFLTGERDLGTGEAGLVLAVFGLGSLLGQPVGGVLADGWGRRSTLLLGLLGSGAALALLGVATALPALLASVLAYGLCLDLVRPAVQAAVGDVVPERDRARAYALNFWAINLGFAVAVPLGGLLAEQGWAWLLGADVASTLVFAFLVWLRVPETRPVRAPDAQPGALRDVLADRVLLALVACLVGQAAVYQQAFTTLPLVMARDGLGSRQYGLALGANGLLIVVLQPLLLGVLAGRARGRLLLAAGVLQGVGLALHGTASTLPQHVAVVVVWTVGEVLQAGLLSSVVVALAPEHLRGRYLGMFGTAFGLASLVGPVLGTQALERLGETALWLGCAAVGCASAAGLLLVSRAADRRTVPAG